MPKGKPEFLVLHSVLSELSVKNIEADTRVGVCEYAGARLTPELGELAFVRPATLEATWLPTMAFLYD